MRKILALSLLAVACSACDTAKMAVRNSLTDRGVIATRDYELGQVLQWIPEEKQLLPLATIEQTPRSFGNFKELVVNFESGVEFKGGVKLTESQQVALENEVASRTSTELKNGSTRALENVVTTVINDWNARPEVWQNELGISDTGWPADGSPFYVALVYSQTLADSIEVEVDRSAAAGAEYSASIQGIDGDVKFKIIDTAAFRKVGASTPVFYEFVIVRIRNTSDGPKFSKVGDKAMRDSLYKKLLNP